MKEPHKSSGGSAVLKRRSRHKKLGTHGKVLVLMMIALTFAFIATSALLSFSGHLHPILKNFGELTLWILYGVVAPLAVISLFQLFRGGVAIRHVIASASVIAAATFALALTFRILTEADGVWAIFDATGFAIAAYAVWICLFSKHASRFFALQGDRRR